MRRVLIVEDNHESAQTIAWLLESFGHHTMIVTDGRQALERALAYGPDVCLLDIGLPGISGYDLCRMLRGEPALQKALYIAQTGWSTPEHRQLSKDAGFDHHLVKPVDFRKLETILQSA
jgi:CheY-like chemotaxis protein